MGIIHASGMLVHPTEIVEMRQKINAISLSVRSLSVVANG